MFFYARRSSKSLQSERRSAAEAQARHDELIRSVHAAFCIVEMIFDDLQNAIDYRFVEVDTGFAAETGLQDAAGRTMRELVPAMANSWVEIFATVDRTHQHQAFDGPAAAFDQRWFRGMAFPTGPARRHRVAVFINNIKPTRHAESGVDLLNARLKKTLAENAVYVEALFNEKERAQVTLNSMGDAVICTDIAGRVTYLNGVAERMTGWAGADALSQRLEEVLHIVEANTRAGIPNPMALAMAQDKVVGLPPRCILIRRDSSEVSIEDSAAPIHDRNGQVTGAVMVFHDVSASLALSQLLSHQAAHDSLTALPNRSLLSDRLARAIAVVHRTQKSLALLHLNLDRFKHINDSFGHAVGDRLLQAVALRLTDVQRLDTVSRPGGDEFVLMLLDVDGEEDVAICAEKILESLRLPYLMDGQEMHVSASIGISIYPQDGAEGEALLRNADSAMYEAKARGRNNYQFYRKDLNATATFRQAIESGLRHAIERQELALDYQPIMDVNSGAITGVEALLRWHSPEQGYFMPADFMGIAEESGLIVPIGRWVLRTACLQARTWHLAGMPKLRFAVNVSAVELRSKDFVSGVAAILDETKMDSSLLELELTETFLMEDSKSTARVLKTLKDLDVRLALDDFGTGYSSLIYMRRFPIDTLKIDRSFVHGLPMDADDASIVSAVINMGKSLNMHVLAEGVETREQLSFLKSQHCDEAQGYLFSRPVTAEKIKVLMDNGRAFPLV